MRGARILIVGAGGREHVIGWKLKTSSTPTNLFFAPGNGGTELIGENVPIGVMEIKKLLAFAKKQKIDLTIVGGEYALSEGIVDAFEKEDLRIFGPSKKASLLETDKAWSDAFMQRHNIPRPESELLNSFDAAVAYVKNTGAKNIVIKATGLAWGKGVFLPETQEEAEEALKRIFVDSEFGKAEEVLIQERIFGREVSIMAFCDGNTIVPMVPAQDHKRVNDGDRGPNTGGIGAFAPSKLSPKLSKEIYKTILVPTLKGMAKEGNPYKGVLYAGLMLTKAGPKVLEYNARFGDPEAQPVLTLLESDFLKIIDGCIKGKLTPEMVSFKRSFALCVVAAAHGYPGKFEKGKEILGLSNPMHPEVVIFQAGTKREGNKFVTDGGRVLGICATGKTMALARSAAYKIIGKQGVHFSGMHFRTDIGKS